MTNSNSPKNPVIKVVVAGAAGRMGQETVKAILETPELQLVDTVGHSGSDLSV
jgi:dihydrodipicolinate reductase